MADFSRLPGPNADLWDWQLRGLCRGKDSSLFFHPEGERGAARSGREVAAKEICTNCPVQIPCVEHALRVREPYGVWGGMTEDEREEHYAKQKVLLRAQAARAKAAKAAQVQLKEQLLREKAAQLSAAADRQPVRAAAVAAQPTHAHAGNPTPQPTMAQQTSAPTARTVENLAGTVASVRRARTTSATSARATANELVAGTTGAPGATAPKKSVAKSAPKSAPATGQKTGPKSAPKNTAAKPSPKSAPKRLAKV